MGGGRRAKQKNTLSLIARAPKRRASAPKRSARDEAYWGRTETLRPDLATNPGWAGPEIAERGLPPPFHTALLPLVN